MNKITITIAGKAASGKSRIAYLIKEMLKVHDFEVEFDPSPDFINESQFNKTMRTNFDEISKVLAEQTKIVIEEKQLQRK